MTGRALKYAHRYFFRRSRKRKVCIDIEAEAQSMNASILKALVFVLSGCFRSNLSIHIIRKWWPVYYYYYYYY